MVRVWERWLRAHADAEALPLVLPVLLHHGPTGWRAAPEFASVLDAPAALLEAARPFQPMFRFVVDDLAVASPDQLAGRYLHAVARLTQLALWTARSYDRLVHAEPFMRAIIRTEVRGPATREFRTQFYRYLLQAAPPDVDPIAIRATFLESLDAPDKRAS